jgi:hypothetical protein
MKSKHKVENLLIVGLSLFLLSSCTSESDPTRMSLESADQLASTSTSSERLKPFYKRLYLEGESNATLNRMRLASAALECGEWKSAEESLDVIIPQIESLGPADPRSREALSNFSSEDIKRFKGEPYERAMVYLLRGILYMLREDWGNARSCLKSAQLQDLSSEGSNQEGDWASADWLEGWCNHMMGDISAAKESWARAEKHSGGKLTAPSSNDSAICIAFLGYGPIKIRMGREGERLTYREGNSLSAVIKVKLNQEFKVVPQAENLFQQASSRGSRKMDEINEGKAETKETANTAADVLTTGGIGTTMGGAMAHDKNVAIAGLGAAAVGLITKAVSSSIKPKADVRTWNLLPATIHLTSFPLSSTQQSLDFEILDASGRAVHQQKFLTKDIPPSKIIFLTER